MIGAGLAEAGRRILASPATPACEPVGSARWAAPASLDDRTVDYLLAVQGGFEALGDVSRALAALLILRASGVRVTPDHPALCQARRDLATAEASIRPGRPTPRAVHPHRHLLACVEGLRAILVGLWDGRDGATARALALLREASRHLQAAAGALPGLEVVALAEGCACCAGRLASRRT